MLILLITIYKRAKSVEYHLFEEISDFFFNQVIDFSTGLWKRNVRGFKETNIRLI